MPEAAAQSAAGKLAALKVGINDASDTLMVNGSFLRLFYV